MKSFILTYPGFQTLPRGIKQMLVASENNFFGDAKPALAKSAPGKLAPLPASHPRAAGSGSAWARDVNAAGRN